MKIDLNCDLGEHEPPARTRALMRLITSANVACGGHAGTAATMAHCASLARARNVRLGAHPGLPGNFGRAEETVTPAALRMLMLHQIAALEAVARHAGARLHHVKLHGVLYRLTEKNAALRRAYLQTIRDCWPGLVIFASATGTVARQARAMKLKVWEEAFADRAYEPDGSLVPRAEPRAVHGPAEALGQAASIIYAGKVITRGDGTISMKPRTLCVHGDSPRAVEALKAIRKLI
jgi:UPF0271 protein